MDTYHIFLASSERVKKVLYNRFMMKETFHIIFIFFEFYSISRVTKYQNVSIFSELVEKVSNVFCRRFLSKLPGIKTRPAVVNEWYHNQHFS